jgi:hypothetical protein
MKTIFFLLVLSSCTQKYADYDLIRKVDFNKESYERPITAYQVVPTGRDSLGECFNQWLFFSNAEKRKDEALPTMVRVLCPKSEYLLNAEMVERWWTTIVFSQSCVKINTQCAELKR